MESNDANLSLITTPFGMVANEWPGVHDQFDDLTRRTHEEDGILYTTIDMMKMEVLQLPSKNATIER